MANKFPIPAEYQDALRFSPSEDTRTDAEILAALNQHIPVKGERNVWAYWHSGVLSMTEWQQRNVCDWVRLCGDSWTVRVLDKVPESPNYVFKFIEADQVPRCYRDGTMDGLYVGQHSADFVRGACLCRHGGVWADVGLILFRSFDRICWDKLEDPDSPYEVFAAHVNGCMASNYLVAARKGNPLIRRWHEVFCAVWEGKNNCKGASEHPLMTGIGIDFDSSAMWGEGVEFDMKVTHRELLEYVMQMVCWARVCMCAGRGDGSLPGGPDADANFDGAAYWQRRVLLCDVEAETQAQEAIVGWAAAGPASLRAWSCPTDADPASDRYRVAHRVAWRMLSASCVQKVARGTALLNSLNLGTYWDMPEYRGADRAPGTFAELIRYGAVNFEQTRAGPKYVKAPAPPRTYKKGHLDP